MTVTACQLRAGATAQHSTALRGHTHMVCVCRTCGWSIGLVSAMLAEGCGTSVVLVCDAQHVSGGIYTTRSTATRVHVQYAYWSGVVWHDVTMLTARKWLLGSIASTQLPLLGTTWEHLHQSYIELQALAEHLLVVC